MNLVQTVMQNKNLMNLCLKAVGAMLRGESPTEFLKNVAKTNPALQGYDFDDLEQLIENREPKHLKDSKLISLHKDDPMDYEVQIIMPIISSSGDCIGSITMVSKDSNALTEVDEKILKIASNFLGKQVQ